MARVLHVQGSPRGDASFSARAAAAFLKAYLETHDGGEAETLDLFAADLPGFDAPAAEAKYQVMAGQEPADEAARAWKRVVRAVDQLKAADVLLISAPMWNFGIPYRLKQWLDVIVQPGLTFSWSPEQGYRGLVTGRPAVLVLARGGDYSPGSGRVKYDMQKPYLDAIVRFIGFTGVHAIIIEPTLQGGPEVARQKLDQAIAQATELARRV
jgi:FMN-dependent NADH-azoreductase